MPRSGDPYLPTREEAAGLVPPRGGVTWRIAGDARLFAASGYALLLQVSHPSVGAGVTQHSNFKQDPWGRLIRTLDYTSSMIYGGPDLAWEVGRRIRRDAQGTERCATRRPALSRRSIRSPTPGSTPHWRSPFSGATVSSAHPALSPGEVEVFWAEWRRMGRLVGVSPEDLPTDSARPGRLFRPHGREPARGHRGGAGCAGIASRPGCPAGLVDAREHLAPPALAGDPGGLWPRSASCRRPCASRLGIVWSPSEERSFQVLARIARTVRPLMPPQAKSFGQTICAGAGGDRAARLPALTGSPEREVVWRSRQTLAEFKETAGT